MEDNAIYTESNESDNEAAIEEDVESEILRGFLYAKRYFLNGSEKVGSSYTPRALIRRKIR